MAIRGKPMTGRQEMMMMMQMVMSMGTNLASFLFRTLKSFRIWLLIAILLTIVQVISDILIAFPFKFILDKFVSHKNPALPDKFLALFDTFGTTAGLRPGESHTVLGIILLSVCVLILLNALSALATYVQNTIASVVGKNLTAQLRTDLFTHIQRLTLDWHNRQRKGDIIQRLIGDIASLERFVTMV